MIVPKIVYRDKVLGDSWARWFNYRTHRKNQNNLVSVIGSTGSGKTWSAISICEIMSKMDGVPFGIEHIVFSLRELMDLINSGTLKRGSKIIFDEPQVSISARDFQSEANKVFNYLLSTFRHRNFSLFFCTPFETLLDKNTRKLFHVRITTSGINLKDNTCRLIPHYLEHVDFKEQPYHKRLLIITKSKDGKGFTSQSLDFWDVPKPSKELLELYEAKKLAFTTNLNKNIEERLNKFDKSGKSMTSVQEAPIEIEASLREKVLECMRNGIKKQKDIAIKLGTSPENIHYCIKAMKNKKILIEHKVFEEINTKNLRRKIISEVE